MAQSVWTGGSHHTGLAALPHENIHILYNFGIFLANEAALEKQKQQLEIEQQHQSQNKYHYQVDFSSALRIARKYFWRDSRTEKDIIHLMIKYVHAVKEELRQFSRPLRGIGAVHFAFR